MGNKKLGYFKSVIDQVAARVLYPKRHIIQSMRRLHALQHAVDTSLACDLSESESDSSSESDRDHEVSNVTKYKILGRLGIDLDLKQTKNQCFIQDLIGECLSLQSSFDKTTKLTN